MTERLDEGWRDDIAAGQLHDVDGHGVAVDFPHHVLDSYRTDWDTGCWDKGFAERMPVMVFNHDPNLLIGAGVRNESLPGKTRLIGRFANFAKVPKAEEAHSLLEDKIFPGWSFHYREGRTVAHPSQRGARRFVSARMLEFCPVTFPSIPGAVTAGIRAEEATLEIPSIDEIIRLKNERVIDEEGMRALIAEHHPHLKDHIKVTTASGGGGDYGDRLAELTVPIVEAGYRDLVIHVGADGTVSSANSDDFSSMGPDDGDDEDPATLASAVDAALDEACRLLEGVDVSSLPDPVQQACALVQAAGVAVDELLDVMGVDDPDDDGDRAQLSAKQMNDAPDSDFAYIEDGGTKDGSGKTVPRDKRHFYIADAAHVRNALARIGQGAAFGKEALPAVKTAAKKFDVTVDPDIDTKAKSGAGGSGSRSEPEPSSDPALEADLEAALERLGVH